eukprot:scaffold619330_cov46-Prasinocladus_malaysianus.AAC.1
MMLWEHTIVLHPLDGVAWIRHMLKSQKAKKAAEAGGGLKTANQMDAFWALSEPTSGYKMTEILRELVGYSIRFEDCTSPDTIIKYMTDGESTCQPNFHPASQPKPLPMPMMSLTDRIPSECSWGNSLVPRRHAAARDPRERRPRQVQRHHHGRGPRAQPQHRRPLWHPQEGAAQMQAGGPFVKYRFRAVCTLFVPSFGIHPRIETIVASPLLLSM